MSLINEKTVIFNCDATTREQAITKMADAMDNVGRLCDKEQYIADVLAREEDSSTAVGFDYATPHARSTGVSEATLGFMRFANPIKWDENSEPVKAAFQIAVPEGAANEHLEILAKIFRKLIHEDFRESLSNATTETQIVEMIENDVQS